MNLYETLVWRGLIKDVSNEEQAKELLNNQKIKFYCGFDPTGLSLTVGHLVQIMRMRLLQSYGHQPVVLIGGATGLIGDPRQTSERKLLTLDESLENANRIRSQISKYLDPKNTIYVNNYDWISNISVIEFLRDYGKNFNINYMLAKDAVASRLETGISYTEFSYMILQSLDFLKLYEEENVLVQFGGSDQWGNITAGLDLIRKVKGENNAVGLSSPLLLKADGTKFGKSESGALWLDSNLTTPYEIYQYFLNTTDADVVLYLKTLTLLGNEEIMKLEVSLKEAPEKREAQKALAEFVTCFLHGEEAVKSSIDVSQALFTGTFASLSKNAFSVLEKTLDTVKLTANSTLIEALVRGGLASSNREARTHITSGAIFVNENKITDVDYVLNQENAYYQTYVIIRRGKKKYALGVY